MKSVIFNRESLEQALRDWADRTKNVPTQSSLHAAFILQLRERRKSRQKETKCVSKAFNGKPVWLIDAELLADVLGKKLDSLLEQETLACALRGKKTSRPHSAGSTHRSEWRPNPVKMRDSDEAPLSAVALNEAYFLTSSSAQVEAGDRVWINHDLALCLHQVKVNAPALSIDCMEALSRCPNRIAETWEVFTAGGESFSGPLLPATRISSTRTIDCPYPGLSETDSAVCGSPAYFDGQFAGIVVSIRSAQLTIVPLDTLLEAEDEDGNRTLAEVLGIDLRRPLSVTHQWVLGKCMARLAAWPALQAELGRTEFDAAKWLFDPDPQVRLQTLESAFDQFKHGLDREGAALFREIAELLTLLLFDDHGLLRDIERFRASEAGIFDEVVKEALQAEALIALFDERPPKINYDPNPNDPKKWNLNFPWALEVPDGISGSEIKHPGEKIKDYLREVLVREDLGESAFDDQSPLLRELQDAKDSDVERVFLMLVREAEELQQGAANRAARASVEKILEMVGSQYGDKSDPDGASLYLCFKHSDRIPDAFLLALQIAMPGLCILRFADPDTEDDDRFEDAMFFLSQFMKKAHRRSLR